MKAVGPLTQAAIDAQVFEPGLRLSIFDELGTEFTLPFDAVIGWPRAEFDLDRMTWRYTLRVRMNEVTAGLVHQGRDIKAWRSFAPGEEDEEFTGFIADLKEKVDYSRGSAEEAWELECYGNAARRLDAHLTRFDWKPTAINPGAGEPNNRAKVTGIVKRYKVTITYSHSTVSTSLSAPPPDETTIKVTSSAGFFAGDIVWLVAGGWTESHRVTSVPDGTTLKVDGGVRLNYWPMETVAKKGVGIVPISGPFYFPDLSLPSHLKLYDSTNVERPTSWGWGVLIDVSSGALAINFTANPGATFTVDVFVMDRWVVLDRRRYNGALQVPYFYVLAGIQGQPGAERLNDQARTTVVGLAPHNDFYVADPTGIFASDTYSDRWISVWSPNGTEYRGKVATVDKTPGSPTYGRITTSVGYAIKSAGGTTPSDVFPGWEVGNTSSTHYEILDPSNRIVFFDSAGNYGAHVLKAEPRGGWMFFGFKDSKISYFVPGYEPTPSYTPGISLPSFKPLPGWPKFHAIEYPFAVPLVAGNYDPSQNAPGNDVAEFFRQLLEAVGYNPIEIDLDDTGYTLAPLTRTQVKAQDLMDEVRKALIPPNYRIWEDEGGIIRGRYVTQKSAADVRLQNIQSFIPKELPKPLTRVIVKGKQIEINRAGQLFYASEGIGRIERLFDGFQDQYANAAPMNLIVDPAGDIYAAYAAFRIPACEPGRYPNVAKVVVATGDAHISVGGGVEPEPTSTTRYLPTGIKPYDATQVFERLEYTDFAPIALAGGMPGERWFLVVAAEAGGGGWLDEIEVWLREGAYWETALTDDTNKANAGGGWKQPDRDLSISYRHVDTDQLKRMMTNYAKGLDRVLVVEAEGITTAQAREVGEAYLDQALRGSEFFEVQAPFDPRTQPTDTVEAIHQVYEDDGAGGKRKVWRSRLMTVWGMTKDRKTMKLKLGDFSR